MTAQLLPDADKLGQFADAVFRHANPRGYVSARVFHDKGSAAKDDKPITVMPISLGDPQFDGVMLECARQAAQFPTAAVFCPPIVTFKDGKSARAENVLEGVTLTVDCDQSPKAARATLSGILGHPTIVVASGGEWANPDTGKIELKTHLHWRLKVPARTAAEHEQLREARSLALLIVGGDPSAAPPVHPLRWPGSWHRKGEPKLADIVLQTDNEIDLADALALLREKSGAKSEDVKFSRESDLEADNPDDIAAALKVIPNDNLSWAEWNNIGLAIYGATGGTEQGAQAWAEWSGKAQKNDPGVTAGRWQHFHRSPPTRSGFGTLVYLARQHAPNWTPNGNRTEQDEQPAQQEAIDPVDLWGKFDPPTLPRGILPDIIERFAFDQGRDMGADMAGIAVSALATCAAAIPDKIQLQVKRHNSGWRESARLWVALIGPPSTMKSPIMATAVRPLRNIDSEMARQYAEAKAAYDRLPKEEKSAMSPPKHKRLMLQDTTIEAAQEVLRDSPDGVLCYQDEMSGWFGSMDKYSGGRGAAKDRAFWLEAFNGQPYSVHRIGRGPSHIENLSVSLIGGIQPDPIRRLADESVDDGLLQRLLPVVLKTATEGTDETMSPVVSEYSALINRLHQMVPHETLRFDAPAQNYRKELEHKHLELQACEAINPKLAAHIGKYNGIFARLCLIWHCVENANSHIISERTARQAGAFLHQFLLPHAVAFYAGMLGLSNDHDRLTAVAGYILARKLDRLTSRDIQRGDRTMRKMDKQSMDTIFHQLHALGWISPIPGPRPSSPTQWLVNTFVHAKFAERAKVEAERRAREQKMIAQMFGR